MRAFSAEAPESQLHVVSYAMNTDNVARLVR